MSTKSVTIQFPFLAVLTLIFITLKLIGTISWSWWWVLAPLWLPFAIIFGGIGVFFLGVFIASFVADALDKLVKLVFNK